MKTNLQAAVVELVRMGQYGGRLKYVSTVFRTGYPCDENGKGGIYKLLTTWNLSYSAKISWTPSENRLPLLLGITLVVFYKEINRRR